MVHPLKKRTFAPISNRSSAHRQFTSACRTLPEEEADNRHKYHHYDTN